MTKSKKRDLTNDQINEEIEKLKPLETDTTICWTCKNATTCIYRKYLLKTKNIIDVLYQDAVVFEFTKNGIKIISCDYYKRDCFRMTEFCDIIGISYRAFLKNKDMYVARIAQLKYRMDTYTPNMKEGFKKYDGKK